jgi:hypothetical protein
VVEKEPVKEHLIRVLQSPQIDVPLEVVVLSLVSLVSAHDLLFQCFYMGRKKPEQTK